VSGVVALMLQANPDLGYRDVMEILAYSARNSDPGSATWQTNGAHDWNGGGLHFSSDYGFGLVDAGAAVRLAESWQKQSTFANLSNVTVTHSDNLAIPDGTGAASSQLTVDYDLRLDKVLVELNITHAAPADLTVTLTSPGGTSAVLASHPANGTGTGIVFETSASIFWSENAHGTWTLSVGDSVAGNSGKLVGWTLQALGDAPGTPTTYVYTDEFATAVGTARSVLTDASGTAGINTAAVSSGSWLDLNPGAVDTIAGRSVTIGSGTVLKTAWGGDGNDTITANGAGNLIEGGRGNDTLVAGAGADHLWGGPDSDTFVFKAPGPADTIGDFAVAADYLDLRPLLAAIGYTGSNAAADGWVGFAAAGGDTMVSIDAHGGLGLQAVVQLAGVASDQLHPGGNVLLG
jgi:subtilisin-like proprotein convertase family protein